MGRSPIRWLGATLVALSPLNAVNVAITTDIPLMAFAFLAMVADPAYQASPASPPPMMCVTVIRESSFSEEKEAKRLLFLRASGEVVSWEPGLALSHAGRP